MTSDRMSMKHVFTFRETKGKEPEIFLLGVKIKIHCILPKVVFLEVSCSTENNTESIMRI